MYYTIVKRKIRQSFQSVNDGDLDAIVRQFTPTAEHWFSGDHALGGRRDDPQQIAEWYSRLGEVLPDLHFTITDIAVNGPPWNTVAMVEWVDNFHDAHGQMRSNQGVHVIHLAWGRLTSLHIYCDTNLLVSILEDMGQAGRPQAAHPPIGEVVSFSSAG